MRRLTPSEVRLVRLLGVVLLLVALVFVIVYYKRSVDSLRLEIADLRNQKAESDFWMDEKPLWDKRAEWMRGNMPVLPGDGSASSAFLEDMQRSARSSGLEIDSQSLLDPVAAGGVEEYALRMRVSGSLESFTRWMASLQDPAKFQAVTALNVKSDAEPPDVVCELQITRFYQQNPGT